MNKIFNKQLLSILIILSTSLVTPAQMSEDKPGEKIVIDGKTYYLHEVKKGEGLFRISANSGISQKDILEVNPEIKEGLKEGQLIKIPVIEGRNSTAEEIKREQFIYHTVEKGETAYFISRKYNVDVETIYNNNPGAKQKLVKGAIIKIPKQQVTSTPSHTTQKTEATETSNAFIFHTVKPKETLYGLSKKYKTNIDDIIKYNPALKSGKLTIGSNIRFPKFQEKKDTQKKQKDKALEDKTFVYHKIEAGQTLYSIASLYKINVEDITVANNNISPDDLEVGYLLRIPKKAIEDIKKQEDDEKYFTLHKVKKGETLFAIARKYEIDIEALKQANDINLENINKGEEINIPNQLWLAEKYDSLNDSSSATVLTHETLYALKAACDSFNYLDHKPAIQVAILLPFAVEESKKANAISDKTNGQEIIKERKEKTISLRSKVFVEFYQGVLLAVDSLKKQGTNINLVVHDISPDTSKINQILAQPHMLDVDLIIGPARPYELRVISEFSKKHNIPVVYPFSTNNPDIINNPNIYQMMPVDTLLFDIYAKKMTESIEGKRIIMIRTEKTDDAFENKLSQVLRDKIYWESFRKGIQPDFVEYNFKQDDLPSLQYMFKNDVENIILVPSIEEAQVNRIITTVKGAVAKNKCTATIWGFPEWLKFQTISPEDIHSLNGKIFCHYHVDYTSKSTQSIINKYHKWFKSEPIAFSPYFQNATVHSNMSRYSLWGYDLSYFFISAIKEYGNHFDPCITSHHPFTVQSNIQLQRKNNWSGYYNTGLFILNFTKDLKFYKETIQ